MFNLGFGEILVICVVLIIVVGPERLPSLMKTVGKAVRTVRQASREIQSTVGLDEILREDVLNPLPMRAPMPPPAATISRDAPAPVQPADAESAAPSHADATQSEPHASTPPEMPSGAPASAAHNDPAIQTTSQHNGSAGGEKGQG
jgi:sec-independent protein translocase protein TatB